MQSTEDIIALFRQKGLHVTPQRRAILAFLSGDNTHPTADQVYRRVVSVMPDISRTTVYNTLRELVEFGQLAPIEDVSEGGVRYDTNMADHHHLFCVCCNSLVDIAVDLEGLELPADQADGYRIVKSQVTFYGICPDCQRGEA